MKLANAHGRATLVVDGRGVDIERLSEGAFGPEIQSIYRQWDAFLAASAAFNIAEAVKGADDLDEASLLSPAPSPRQVFAIGLNYRAHAEESGMTIPSVPATFTKFPASLAGPFADIERVGETVDWEVELVVVIGRDAYRVAETDGWSHVAGLTVGQDISERTVQFAAGSQFSLGKSFKGFGPMGPWLVTPDEFDNPDDIGLRCSLNGEVMQDSHTSDLIFNVPQLIAELSAILPLLAGDVIFTGTPAGVGVVRKPPRFLQVGDVLETTIDGIGTLRNHVIAPKG